jgi:hypothetical protein
MTSEAEQHGYRLMRMATLLFNWAVAIEQRDWEGMLSVTERARQFYIANYGEDDPIMLEFFEAEMKLLRRIDLERARAS